MGVACCFEDRLLGENLMYLEWWYVHKSHTLAHCMPNSTIVVAMGGGKKIVLHSVTWSICVDSKTMWCHALFCKSMTTVGSSISMNCRTGGCQEWIVAEVFSGSLGGCSSVSLNLYRKSSYGRCMLLWRSFAGNRELMYVEWWCVHKKRTSAHCIHNSSIIVAIGGQQKTCAPQWHVCVYLCVCVCVCVCVCACVCVCVHSFPY